MKFTRWDKRANLVLLGPVGPETGAAPAAVRLQPGWMTVVAVLCFATCAVTLVSDLFVPAARGTEVWFGFEVTGPLALATAPLHWAMFATAGWAFWTGRIWIVGWAAAYLFYVAMSHLVWSEVSPHGRGWPIGLVQATVIGGLAYLLLCLRELETTSR
jgi:hypothetical protein